MRIFSKISFRNLYPDPLKPGSKSGFNTDNINSQAFVFVVAVPPHVNNILFASRENDY